MSVTPGFVAASFFFFLTHRGIFPTRRPSANINNIDDDDDDGNEDDGDDDDDEDDGDDDDGDEDGDDDGDEDDDHLCRG